MDAISISFLLLFSHFISTLTSTQAQECLIQVCRYQDPVARFVRFPLWIQNETLSNSCKYPGFGLFCDGSDQLLLELPNSGVFRVEAIEYAREQIWVSDPDDCLPRKLLSLSLSGSSFRIPHHQLFFLYNCSESLPDFKNANKVRRIGCLSGSGYEVVATTSKPINNSQCNPIGSIQVPTGSKSDANQDVSPDSANEIRIKWAGPDCGKCFKRGGQCRLKKNSIVNVECFNIPHHGISGSALFMIALAFAIPLALFLILIVYCIRKLRHPAPSAPTTAPPTYATTGLDRTTIESYPKVVLGQSRRLPRPDEKSCPICLGEYQPKEGLRTLPECGHCFHVECVDEWLSRNGTCPVCRQPPSLIVGDHVGIDA